MQSQDTLQVHSASIAIKAPFGDTELANCLDSDSRVQYVEFVGATLRRGDEDRYEMNLDTPVRFAPGSHIGMEYHADRYRHDEDRIKDPFETAISIAMTDDATLLRTAFKSSQDSTEWQPDSLNFKVYYEPLSTPTSREAQLANLPRYRLRAPIAAVEITDISPIPLDNAFMLVTTSPLFEDLRVSKEFLESRSAAAGGYLLFYPDGSLEFQTADNFNAHYERVSENEQDQRLSGTDDGSTERSSV